jgi:P4 family phage/plasmid primase-like protien
MTSSEKQTQYVYVLQRGDMLKIGESHSGEEGLRRRVREINGTGNLPDEWKPILALSVEDSKSVEKRLHLLFEDSRIYEGREFFSISFPKLKRIIDLLLQEEVIRGNYCDMDSLFPPTEARSKPIHIKRKTPPPSPEKPTSPVQIRIKHMKDSSRDTKIVVFDNGIMSLKPTFGFNEIIVPNNSQILRMGVCQQLDAIPWIPYNPLTPTKEHMELQDFFSKIYPDSALREYALTLFSSCLEGANHEQNFYIMSGAGSNGISTLFRLLGRTFGAYLENPDSTLLTRGLSSKRSKESVYHKRIILFSEPEEGEKLQYSNIKFFTEGDDLTQPTYKMFMSCNDLPPVSMMDQSNWHRIRVIPHISTFVEEGKPADPASHVYIRDIDLDSKIIRWRPYFAGMLTWYYENKYLRSGLQAPPHVKEASYKYREENDAFAAFAQDCLLREVGAEIRTNNILVRYKEWIRYNPGKKVLNKKDIISKMTEIYGNPIYGGRVYVGVRIAEEGEDVSGNVISSAPGFSTATVAVVEA